MSDDVKKAFLGGIVAILIATMASCAILPFVT